MPRAPKAYYILHVNNLPKIIEAGALLSDQSIRDLACTHDNIGMNEVKSRRLVKPVSCHDGTMVGQYVPFYLCPRSLMLYVIYRKNHPALTYRGGQEPIVHLEFDVRSVVVWAREQARPWAAAFGNAAADMTEFATGAGTMARMNWQAIASNWFTEPEIAEAKQSEFLVFGHVAWHLVERIGVINMAMRQRVVEALQGATHRPAVSILPGWYF